MVYLIDFESVSEDKMSDNMDNFYKSLACFIYTAIGQYPAIRRKYQALCLNTIKPLFEESEMNIKDYRYVVASIMLNINTK